MWVRFSLKLLPFFIIFFHGILLTNTETPLRVLTAPLVVIYDFICFGFEGVQGILPWYCHWIWWPSCNTPYSRWCASSSSSVNLSLIVCFWAKYFACRDCIFEVCSKCYLWCNNSGCIWPDKYIYIPLTIFHFFSIIFSTILIYSNIYINIHTYMCIFVRPFYINECYSFSVLEYM